MSGGSRITRAGGTLVLPAAPRLDDDQRAIIARRLWEAQQQIAKLQARLMNPLFLQQAPGPARRLTRTQLAANQREEARLRELLEPRAPRL